MTRTPTHLTAVDVPPHGQRIQRRIGQYFGRRDTVLVEYRHQVLAVTPASLAAGAGDALSIFGRGRTGEVGHLQLRFWVHDGRG